MSYRTVNVKPETYEQLRTYKVGGMSFDDVIQFLMERTDAAVLHGHVRGSAAQPHKPIQFTKLGQSGNSASLEQ